MSRRKQQLSSATVTVIGIVAGGALGLGTASITGIALADSRWLLLAGVFLGWLTAVTVTDRTKP